MLQIVLFKLIYRACEQVVNTVQYTLTPLNLTNIIQKFYRTRTIVFILLHHIILLYKITQVIKPRQLNENSKFLSIKLNIVQTHVMIPSLCGTF